MSQRTSTNEASRTEAASRPSRSGVAGPRLTATANRHVNTITDRMLSVEAAAMTFDGTKLSTQRRGVAATPRTQAPVEAPSDPSAALHERRDAREVNAAEQPAKTRIPTAAKAKAGRRGRAVGIRPRKSCATMREGSRREARWSRQQPRRAARHRRSQSMEKPSSIQDPQKATSVRPTAMRSVLPH
jgi:hypothetical protein